MCCCWMKPNESMIHIYDSIFISKILNQLWKYPKIGEINFDRNFFVENINIFSKECDDQCDLREIIWFYETVSVKMLLFEITRTL